MVTQKQKSYLHEYRVVVDEDGSVFFQPAVTHESSLLFLVLLLTLVTNVPQTFTQFLQTYHNISIYLIFSFLSRSLKKNFNDQFKNICILLYFKLFSHLVSDIALLWSPCLLSYHQVCCWSPSANETLTPASSLDAPGNACTPLYGYREPGETYIVIHVIFIRDHFVIIFC